MTLSYERSLSLKKLSDKKKTVLVSSNIFLFANYFEELLKIKSSLKKIDSVKICWKDSAFETRYGEKKSFDYSVPLFKDVLHHILPIVNQILGKYPEKLENMNISRGGAKNIFRFNVNKTVCHINLERNAKERKRLIEINSNKNKLVLNFSSEKPFIIKNKVKIYSNKNLKVNNKPIATMFKFLFELIYANKKDIRLSLNQSLKSSKIIDNIYKKYLNVQCSWAEVFLNDQSSDYLKEDIDYFMREFFSSKSIDHKSALIKLKSYKKLIN